MVAEGGNTVLQILKELHAETGDLHFQTIHCLFEPWVSESATLIAHLVENDARGELFFIDRARAVHELRRLLEHEMGGPLSALKLATLLREQGYGTSKPSTTLRAWVDGEYHHTPPPRSRGANTAGALGSVRR
ncbi:MAG: hypothetical protein ACREYF_10200 [Gammaproteobacteria bacterium]